MVSVFTRETFGHCREPETVQTYVDLTGKYH